MSEKKTDLCRRAEEIARLRARAEEAEAELDAVIVLMAIDEERVRRQKAGHHELEDKERQHAETIAQRDAAIARAASRPLAESRIHTAASAVPDIAEGSDYVRCPGCGYRHRDLYEHGLEDGQTGAVECGCGHTFEITCRVSITYTVEEASHG